jgi:hypothetical protein
MSTILDLTDGELIDKALTMWANHIETATIEFSAIDAEAAKKPFKALSLEQMKLVIRLRELATQMGS